MKTFVWVIGKPGSGKSTAGERLAKLTGGIHLSYGDLLKQAQPAPSKEGYTQEDRLRANELLIEAAIHFSTVVVDGNPYSKLGFGFLDQIKANFDVVHIIHLVIDDEAALSRLKNRNREVLEHDGASELTRVQNFNAKLLPLIEAYKNNSKVIELAVEDHSPEKVGQLIQQGIADLQ